MMRTELLTLSASDMSTTGCCCRVAIDVKRLRGMQQQWLVALLIGECA